MPEEKIVEATFLNNKHKVLDYEWRAGIHTIGVVAYEKDDGWMAAIGMAGTMGKNVDLYMVCAHGATLKKAEAIAFFPSLDPKTCKND